MQEKIGMKGKKESENNLSQGIIRFVYSPHPSESELPPWPKLKGKPDQS